MKNIKHICEVGVGHIGVCFSNLYWDNPNIKFSLFEPNKDYYKELLNKSNKRPNVFIYNVAIGDYNGKTILIEEQTSSYIKGLDSVIRQTHRTAGAEYLPKNSYEINIATIDIFDDGTIDYLLLDTEGSEWFTLKYLISRPFFIQIETHTGKGEYKNPYLNQIEEWMKLNNYIKTGMTHTDSMYQRNW